MHAIERRVFGGAIVSGVTLIAVPGNRSETASRVQFVNTAAGQLHNVHVALFVEVNTER